MKRTIKLTTCLILVLSLAAPLAIRAENTGTASITITPGKGNADTYLPDNTGTIRSEDDGAAIKANNPIIDNSTSITGLTIDTVPSFPFPDVQLGATRVSSTNYDTPYVQVSDRRGTSQGWHLTVKSGDLALIVNDLPSTTTIPYTLNMVKGAIVPGGTTLASNPPVYSNITPTVLALTDTTSTSVSLVNADVGKGNGAWITRLYGTDASNKTTLSIDTTNISTGTYKATITWGLTAGPQGS